jgi:hypothetical protein
MREQITPERVCKTLEALSAYQEHLVNDDPFVSAVYRFTHIAQGSCRNLHPDWVDDFLTVEKDMIEAYYTAPKP